MIPAHNQGMAEPEPLHIAVHVNALRAVFVQISFDDIHIRIAV